MATISKQDDKLVITLSAIEKVEALRGGFEIPLQAIEQVEIVENPIKEVHGLRPSSVKAYGMYVPGEVAVGIFLSDGLKEKPSFIAVHHNDKRGVRIALRDAKFSQLLIGCDDPEKIAEELS